MQEQWTLEQFAENWIKAQGQYGDLWRVELTNPLLLRMCEELARGGSEACLTFSAFEALWQATQSTRDLPKGQTVDSLAGHPGPSAAPLG